MNWTPDDQPRISETPWPLIIRAKYAVELDAAIASHLLRKLGTVASADTVKNLTEAATKSLHATDSSEEASAEQRVAAFTAILDWDDWCGTPWPHRWPPRRHSLFDDLSDPIAVIVARKALEVVQAAGSPNLNETFGATLERL